MDELEARIEALERAVTDGDHDLSELATEGETREQLAAIETELGDIADRVAELEAATQALRGYVGNVRAVNRDIEQRADAALAKAESVESALVGEEPPADPDERSGHAITDGHRHGQSGGSATGHESGQGESDPSTDTTGWSVNVTEGSSSDPGTGNTGGGGHDRSTGAADEQTPPDDPGRGSPGRSERDTGNGSAGRDHERRQTEQDGGGSRAVGESGYGRRRDRHADGEQAERCDACGRPKSEQHGTDETRQSTSRERRERAKTDESTLGQSAPEQYPGQSGNPSTSERSDRTGSMPGHSGNPSTGNGSDGDRSMHGSSTAGGQTLEQSDESRSTVRDESGAGSEDDPLVGVFESGESDEGGADGTFDRIRQML
jgi:hypothetical protein